MNLPAIRVITCAALLARLLLTAAPAYSQESRISTQAIRCAAIFTVLADTHADDKNREKTFQDASLLFASVFVKERGIEPNQESERQARNRRDLVLQELQSTYREREALILEETILCGSWAEGFRVQGDNYAFVPIIPKIIPQIIRDDYARYAAHAFKRWITPLP